MKVELRRPRERRQLQAKIIAAARRLFAAHGYEAVTMRQIARQIGYTPTAIYFHFKDKESLINELCTTDFLSLAKAFERIARVTDPVERLRKIGRAYAEFGLRHPNHYRVMFMTSHPACDPGDRDIEQGNPAQDGYALLRNTAAEAIQARRLRPGLDDAALVAQTAWAGIHGVVSLEIAKSNDPWVDWRPIKKRIDGMLDVLICGLARD